MASTEARLDIASRRNEARTLTIRVKGADWTALAWRQQIRLYPDAPGAPTLSIAQVQNANAEGFFVQPLTIENGVPVTTVKLHYNMTTMRDQLPYGGEIGSDTKLSHAIQVGGVTRLAGDWWAIATPLDSDAAPVNRAPAYGGGLRAPTIASGVGLTVAAEQIVTITLDGVEQVAALSGLAKVEADRAAAQVPLAAAQVALAATARAGADVARASSEQIRDTFVNTAATAQAAVLAAAGGQYQTISSGLAATAPNGYFYVASGGDVFTTLYQKVNGAAVLVNILAGQSALDRVGRAIVAAPGVDATQSINAALAISSVAGVILPLGDTRTDSAIIIPSNKFLRGFGRGASRLVRQPGTQSGGGSPSDAIVRSAYNALGVQISDLSVVAFKGSTAINGIHMRGATRYVIERVEVADAHYSYWSQEFAQFGVIRDCSSRNANVHFETTQAYDVLHDNCFSDDGDGDNPSGCETVWHPLLASRNITFRDMRHVGKGQPFLVVANDINGDPLNGLIDNIRYIRCNAVMTEGKTALELLKFSGRIGRVELIDCNVVGGPGSILGNIDAGAQAVIRGGKWKTDSQEVFITRTGTRLSAIGVEVDCTAGEGLTGQVYNADLAPILVEGGRISAATAMVAPGRGPNLYISPSTEIIGPGRVIYGPPGVGQQVRYIYPADVPLPSGNDVVGVGTALPRAQFDTEAGYRYRMQWHGRVKKVGPGDTLRAYIDIGAGPIFDTALGFAKIEKADGSYAIGAGGLGLRGSQVGDAVDGSVRQFEIDLTFLAVGSTISLSQGADGSTILAGAELTIERLS